MWLLALVLSAYPMAVQEKAPDRVGRIIIEGNVHAPDRVIFSQLDLRPAQVLKRAKLPVAQTRLKKLGLFEEAHVEVIDNELDSAYKDIRIRVKERSWVWITFAVEDTTLAVLTLDVDRYRGAAYRVQRKLWGAR